MDRETEELASKIAECAREACHQAALLPKGPVRGALLEKAKQYEAQIPADSTHTTIPQRADGPVTALLRRPPRKLHCHRRPPAPLSGVSAPAEKQ